MARIKTTFATLAVMVAMLAAISGPAMAQSFTSDDNVSDSDSVFVVGDEAFFDDDEDDFFFVDEDDFFFDEDGFFFFDDFDGFDSDGDGFDFDGGVSQDIDQEIDETGDVDQSFDIS